MWRRLVVAGTIAVTLLTGTALAFAAQGSPGTPGSTDGTSTDHWSEMAVEMGDEWPAMVDHMQQMLGDRFPDMVKQMQSMEPFGHDMDGRGMWNGGEMGSFGPGQGGPGMWNDDEMGSFEPRQRGPGTWGEGHMGSFGPGQGGPGAMNG
jgi:hypothetical protein